jgi:hypothetical protein
MAMDVGRARAVTAAVLLAVAALAAAGCGGEETVDDAEVEQGIEQSLSTAAVEVTSAGCPPDVKVEEGATFTCTVKLDNGAGGKATVTQEGGNRFTYALKPGSVRIPGATVEAAIETSLAARGAPEAAVTCPETIVVKVGTTVTCDVSGVQAPATGTVTYTFSDASGTVDPASVETS